MANCSLPTEKRTKTVWSLRYARDELLDESKDQYTKKEVSKVFRKEYSDDLKTLRAIRRLDPRASARLLMYHYCDDNSETFDINRERVNSVGNYAHHRWRLYLNSLEHFKNVETTISCEKSGYSILFNSSIARNINGVIISGKSLNLLSKQNKPFSLQHQAAVGSLCTLGHHSLTDLVAVYQAILNRPDMLIRFGFSRDGRNVINFKSIVKHFIYLKSGRKPTQAIDDNAFWCQLTVTSDPKPFCMECCPIGKFDKPNECSCRVCSILYYTKYSSMLDQFGHKINCSR